MTNTNWRDKVMTKWWYDREMDSFIESLLEEARREEREKVKNTIMEYIPKDKEKPDDFLKMYNLALQHCRESIILSTI